METVFSSRALFLFNSPLSRNLACKECCFHGVNKNRVLIIIKRSFEFQFCQGISSTGLYARTVSYSQHRHLACSHTSTVRSFFEFLEVTITQIIYPIKTQTRKQNKTHTHLSWTITTKIQQQ